MLLAEIHGKRAEAVQDDEDYLTSSIFGHLRYIAPGNFWNALFARAKSLPIQGTERSLTEVLGKESDFTQYEKLDVKFWPKYQGLGEPDLALWFKRGGQHSLVILIEVKLWSEKSGQGEHDQLARYLLIADSIRLSGMPTDPPPKVVVLYLTPRESMTEVQQSLIESGDTVDNRCRLFRIQWQDMIEVIDEVILMEQESNQLILNDVMEFLRIRRLEYFRGFRQPTGADTLRKGCGSFYTQEDAFHGFEVVPYLNRIQVVKGAW